MANNNIQSLPNGDFEVEYDLEDNYDLAIMHIVQGPEDSKFVRLTRKAEAGEVGDDVVFEFKNVEELEDFIRQLGSIKREAFGK